jgi:CubicO group peptidase (beta-lactamase class C family)
MRPALTPVALPQNFHSSSEGGGPVKYGFGWFLDPYRGHARMWHPGESTGFRTVIERFTSDGLTIIVLANRTDLDPADLALKVADLFLR